MADEAASRGAPGDDSQNALLHAIETQIIPRLLVSHRRDAASADASAIPWSGWSTQERQRFLGELPNEIPADRLAALDSALGLSQSGNAEVLFAWLMIAIENRYEPALPALENFLTSMGRRKFVAPLFAALMEEGDWGQPIARRIYARARPGYHSVTTGTVDASVGVPQ